MHPEAALGLVRAGRGAALATVVETWGSAPRPVGVAARGLRRRRDGRLGLRRLRRGRGGRRGARGARRTARPRLLDFGVSDDRGLRGRPGLRRADPGAGRAGRRGAGARRRPARAAGGGAGGARSRLVYAVRPETWERRLVAGPADPLWPAAAAALVADRSGFAGDWFLGVHNPPLRMAVVGAVHIAQALVPMARLAGYDVTVDRSARGLRQRRRASPGPRLMHDWPDEALARARARRPHRRRDADPRPEARRPGDRRGARGRRSSTSAASARRAPTPSGSSGCARRASTRRRSRGSTRRSAPTSGRSAPGRDRRGDPRADHRAAAAAGEPALMRFGPVPWPRPRGRCSRIRWRPAGCACARGGVLSAADVAALAAAGVAEVTVARLEAGRRRRGRRGRGAGGGAGARPGGGAG